MRCPGGDRKGSQLREYHGRYVALLHFFRAENSSIRSDTNRIRLQLPLRTICTRLPTCSPLLVAGKSNSFSKTSWHSTFH